MAQQKHIPTLATLEEALTVLFCLIDDAYALLNPRWQSHDSLKKLTGEAASRTRRGYFLLCKADRVYDNSAAACLFISGTPS